MSTNSNNSATASAATADSKQAVPLLPTEVRCSYPSKLCNNHRAVKDNGDLHKLCDFHRKKANVNQQRMQQKRRLIRQQMMERKKRFMDATVQSSMESMMEYNITTNTNNPICDLTPEEVLMLGDILFDDDDDDDNEEGFCSNGLAAGMTYQTYAPDMSSGNMSL